MHVCRKWVFLMITMPYDIRSPLAMVENSFPAAMGNIKDDDEQCAVGLADSSSACNPNFQPCN
jgi:hypothetical protein